MGDYEHSYSAKSMCTYTVRGCVCGETMKKVTCVLHYCRCAEDLTLFSSFD